MILQTAERLPTRCVACPAVDSHPSPIPVAAGAPGRPSIGPEERWRQRPGGTYADAIALGRWSAAAGAREEAAPRSDDVIIEIALESTDLILRVDGDVWHDGRVAAGWVAIAPPGAEVRSSFRAACDMLHIFVAPKTIRSLCAEAGAPDAALRLSPGKPWSEPALERLARALVAGGDLGDAAGRLYQQGLAAAILARVLARASGPFAGTRPAAAGLVGWRLKRVLAFVDARLDEPLRLEDMARCAGLSRMHFAAQFRLATGITPHEHLQRRRIEKARALLRAEELPLVQVALAVGFQTQAHFTTVFRKLTGETPGRWRQRERLPCSS